MLEAESKPMDRPAFAAVGFAAWGAPLDGLVEMERHGDRREHRAVHGLLERPR